MEKFSLMCPWPSSDDLCNKHYLVPSMLRTLPPKQISDLVHSAQLPSLFLKFDTGRVPPGLFPRFVLKFFRWCREKFPGVDLPNTYNNFARFYIFPNQSLSLVLLCHSSTIEVVVLSVNSASDVDSIRAFRNQLTSIIERVCKKFFWVKNVGCEVSFLYPVCSHGRVVSFCPRHRKESCMQEECLHFISESDLGDEKQAVCTNSATALDNSIHAEQFALWISSGKEKVRKMFFSWHAWISNILIRKDVWTARLSVLLFVVKFSTILNTRKERADRVRWCVCNILKKTGRCVFAWIICDYSVLSSYNIYFIMN